MAIQGGVLNGVEYRCDLTSPIAQDDGTRFIAVCSAEGGIYREQMTISQTANGVRIDRDSGTAFWDSCEPLHGRSIASLPSNGPWTFSGSQGLYESATRDGNGNSVSFKCNDIGENGGLYVELDGEPAPGGQISIDVDGTVFAMTVWAEGGRINTVCTVCGDNYTALWNATAAGNLMTVTDSDGRIAAFRLEGSRDALGDVACQPDGGF